MPVPCYLTLIGKNGNRISAGALSEGSVGAAWKRGHEDQILVQSFEHGIAVPGGADSGQRMHKAMIILKDIDKSSPLINAALCDGELLAECRLEFFRVTAIGEEHFYTMELKNSVIIGADAYMHDCRDPKFAHSNPMEKVRFSYQEITWKHETGRTIASDEWRSAGQA
ncbi:Hcp family type VI secretion system effector [Pseudomonas sp. DSP3-2-2]|uniref:Hcp family type VI secretion system effector n=1 Tax=unclassified Pseudomonas TaxID=196821 RepID=UPI003CF78C37